MVLKIVLSNRAGSKNDFLRFGVDRANVILNTVDSTGVNAFVTTVVVPLTKLVLQEKGVEQYPDDAALYTACLAIVNNLPLLTTVAGGLIGMGKDYAQADIRKMVIHVNADWVFSALDSIGADPASRATKVHKTVIVGKVLHGYIHMITRPILKYVYSVQGFDTDAADLDYNTPIKIDRKIIQVQTSTGKALRMVELGDMGLAAEELIFGFRLNLGGVVTEDIFGAEDIIFSDVDRNGRTFKSEDSFDTWANAVITGLYESGAFKVDAKDTKPLTHRKRPAEPAEPATQSAVKVAKKSSSSDQMDLYFDPDALEGTCVAEDAEAEDAGGEDIEEEEGLIPMDIALPAGWKS